MSHPPFITPDNFLAGGSAAGFVGTPGGGQSSSGGPSSRPPFDYSLPGLIGIPELNDFGEWTFNYIRDPTFQQGDRGSGAAAPAFRPGELALLQAELAEQKRANLAQEAAAARKITLDRALGSLTAYNTAQDIANQRRLTAFDQARQLAGFLVPEGTEFFPGLEPTGALGQVSQDFGLPFGGAPVVEQQFDVGALSQPGQVSPQVTQMLAGLGGI